MRIEGNTTADQIKPVNLSKVDQAAEKAVAGASVVDRSSGKSEGRGSGQTKIAGQTLAELQDKTDYDISFQLHFTFHKETKSLVVKVIDPDTNRVIREIPPEELLDLAARIREMLGLLIDEKV